MILAYRILTNFLYPFLLIFIFYRKIIKKEHPMRFKEKILPSHFKIKKKVFNFSNKIDTERKILKILKKNEINLICLAGFLRIISKKFIKNFNGKILNIHPSLLPKYKGLNTHERAIQKNEKFAGCTVHHVTSKLDSGKIILQKKVKISKNETVEKLAKKVLIQEHKIYPRAILKIFNP